MRLQLGVTRTSAASIVVKVPDGTDLRRLMDYRLTTAINRAIREQSPWWDGPDGGSTEVESVEMEADPDSKATDLTADLEKLFGPAKEST